MSKKPSKEEISTDESGILPMSLTSPPPKLSKQKQKLFSHSFNNILKNYPKISLDDIAKEKNEPHQKVELKYKIIIIGDFGTGKSSITLRASKGEFNPYHPKSAVSYECHKLKTQFNGNKIKLQIWDTIGMEKSKCIPKNFYRNTSLAIIAYSVTNRESFNHVEFWLKELKNCCPGCKIVLVGTKADLEDEREVKFEEGEKCQKDYGFLFFTETSSKTGENIDDLINICTLILYSEYIQLEKFENQGEDEKYHGGTFVLDKKDVNDYEEIVNEESCC